MQPLRLRPTHLPPLMPLPTHLPLLLGLLLPLLSSWPLSGDIPYSIVANVHDAEMHVPKASRNPDSAAVLSLDRVTDNKMTPLASMLVTVGRCVLGCAQIKGNLKTNVLERKVGITTTCTGEKQDEYKPRKNVDGGTKLVTSISGLVSLQGESNFKLTNGNLLPESVH